MVPSLSNTAMRSTSGTSSSDPGSVTASTKATIDAFAGVSFQLDRASATGAHLRDRWTLDGTDDRRGRDHLPRVRRAPPRELLHPLRVGRSSSRLATIDPTTATRPIGARGRG